MRTFRDGRSTVVKLAALALMLPAGVVALPSTAFAQVVEASPATNLTAEAIYDEVKLTWSNPVTPDFSGTVVRGKAGAVAPSSPEDGFAVTPDLSIAPSATATELEPSTPYTFAAFAKNLAGEVAAPATVTIGGLLVAASVSPDRVVFGKEVTITGRVTDALTGAPMEYMDIRFLARPHATDEFILIGEDVTRSGGTFTFPIAPPEKADFVVVAVGDAQHLAGAGVTRAVSISSVVFIEPVTKKGKLGTTFSMIGAAAPDLPNVPLVLQEKVKGKWKTVLKKKANKKGLATFKVTPKTKGKHVYRITKAGASGVGAGTSRSITITVS